MLTSTARSRRPSAARGIGRPASTCRNRGTSTFPWFSASYIAPCPRRCSATSVRSTGEVTGPSAHSNASTRSNSSSPRAVRQANSSSRKRDACSNASPGPASGSRLTFTASVSIGAPCSEHMIRRKLPQRPTNAQLGHPVRCAVRSQSGSATVRSTSTSCPGKPSWLTPKSVLAVVNAGPRADSVSRRHAAPRVPLSLLRT